LLCGRIYAVVRIYGLPYFGDTFLTNLFFVAAPQMQSPNAEAVHALAHAMMMVGLGG
jgi:hypothetical protein